MFIICTDLVSVPTSVASVLIVSTNLNRMLLNSVEPGDYVGMCPRYIADGRVAKPLGSIIFSWQKSRCFSLVLLKILRTFLTSWKLRMEAASSSEASVTIYQSMRRYVPEDVSLHQHRCDNLNSCRF
jgi:hypothetical protein